MALTERSTVTKHSMTRWPPFMRHASILFIVVGGYFLRPGEVTVVRAADRQSQSDAHDRAVADGIRWLAAEQRGDGGWRFQRKESEDDERSPCEATGLAVLALLGAGQTTGTGKYAPQIDRAVDFLESWAGVVEAHADLRGDGGTLVSHAIAATALCELRGMIKEPDDRLRRLTEAAVRQTLAWQDEPSGGWGLQPDQPMHLRPTVWQIMLLVSARLAQIEVPDDTLRRADNSLKAFQTADERQTERGPFFGFNGPGSDPTATSLGAYGRLRYGWSPIQPWSRRIADRLLEPDFVPSSAEGKYFANEILHWVGEDDAPDHPHWMARYNDAVRRLIRSQVRDAELAGSWPSDDARATRTETTAYNLLTLEIFYRFRPLSFGGAFRANKKERIDLLRDPVRPVRPRRD